VYAESLMPVSVDRSPLVKFKTLVIISRLRLGVLSFMKEVLIRNLVKMLQNGLLIMIDKKY
jgi:hypothetical protein